MDIPVEIWLWIAQRLDTMDDWFNFCCTCRLFAALGRDLTRAAKKRLARPKMLSRGPVGEHYYELANGDRHGHYICRFNSTVIEADYVDGLREGVYQERDAGSLIWGRYHEGLRQGQWFKQDCRGEVTHTEYSGGLEIESRVYGPFASWKAPGFLVVYGSDGIVARTVHRVEDYDSGEVIRQVIHAYDEKGRLQETSEYLETQYWECTYYSQGHLRSVIFCAENGAREGRAVRWHDNGQLSLLAHYRADGLEGEVYNYYRNGALQSVTEYKEGKRHGFRRKWGKSGALRSMVEYYEGKRRAPAKK